jgi:hypothetical protein
VSISRRPQPDLQWRRHAPDPFAPTTTIATAWRDARGGALRIPEGFTLRALSDPESGDAVTDLLRQSSDHTLYHLGPYIDFTRAQNGIADVFLVSRDGNALFAVTVHS